MSGGYSIVYLLCSFSPTILTMASTETSILSAASFASGSSRETQATHGDPRVSARVEVARREALRLVQRHPGVRADLLEGQPLRDFADEDLGDEVSGSGRDVLGDLELAGEDLVVEHGLALVVEGQVAAEHGEEGDAAAPDVDGDGVVGLARDDLRQPWRPRAPRSTASHRRS